MADPKRIRELARKGHLGPDAHSSAHSDDMTWEGFASQIKIPMPQADEGVMVAESKVKYPGSENEKALAAKRELKRKLTTAGKDVVGDQENSSILERLSLTKPKK